MKEPSKGGWIKKGRKERRKGEKGVRVIKENAGRSLFEDGLSRCLKMEINDNKNLKLS